MTPPDPADSPAPTVRLRPTADARRLRHGHPWAYDDELVLDRRTRAIPPGTPVVLTEAGGGMLGLWAFNAGSRIAARLLDRDPAAGIGADWFEARLAAALALRARLYPDPFYRLVHAEADGLPGVVIDRFGDAAVLQPNAAWADRRAGAIAAALARIAGVRVVVLNGTGRARALEGLSEEMRVLSGAVEGPVPVPMNGAIYFADLLAGQKTGLYFDQRDTHAFVARLAAGARVLDVFTHVGGFALAALAGGAERALAIDGSAAALELAARGAAATGVAGRLELRRADAFAALAALGAAGERFDVVVCDPPAFAPAKQALAAGLRAYERLARLAAALVAPGGFLTLCSCSHAADLAAFRAACTRGLGRAGRAAQLIRTGFAGPDHPLHPALPETGYLKALTWRILA
jgi:23S rRNA (cytosine1962-C5)-methyltransferase